MIDPDRPGDGQGGTVNHKIGLLLGTENDWPTAFAELLERAKLSIPHAGRTHSFSAHRIPIEPFDLRHRPDYAVVIDRLAYWYHHPREWLKKVAMMDEIYLLNNPFTFQSMEKHTAFCGMIRLGVNIPDTWLLPPKIGPSNERFEETARRYNRLFSLHDIGVKIGYPMYLKPFDGGAWVGVTKVDDIEALRAAYDSSGDRMMHLQKGIVDYDVFSRALSIGPQTMVMRYQPEKPMHERYAIDHNFLDPRMGRETQILGRLVNAFFRWEFNSCETIIKDGVAYPIDFANAVPDVAITSLHYYFPWAMKALVRWSVFVAATGRRMAIDMNKRRYYAIGDDESLSYEEKLDAYEALSHEYFQTDAFEEFCATHLGHLEEVALEYFESEAFDALLVSTVQGVFPDHEHDRFVAHFRGLLGHWCVSERNRLDESTPAASDGITTAGGGDGVASADGGDGAASADGGDNAPPAAGPSGKRRINGSGDAPSPA